MAERPVGERYSLIYIDRGEPSPEVSKQARRRIARQFSDFTGGDNHVSFAGYLQAQSVADFIESEIGIEVPRTRNGVGWAEFFTAAPTPAILDSVWAFVQRNMATHPQEGAYPRFIGEVRRIFSEENLAYEIDDEGGVHPLVDPAFSNARQLAMAALSGDRYAATLAHVEKIDPFLLADPPDYTSAVRAAFDANETLFRLMYSQATKLGSHGPRQCIEPDLRRLYQDKSAARAQSVKLLGAFSSWIEAAHFERHAKGTEETVQPPEELAILLVSQGLAFVRWLARLDAKIRASAADPAGTRPGA